jgi:hypothetical protein
MFGASSAFFALSPDWLGVALGILLLAASATLVTRWSRHQDWVAAHRYALAGGALLTYVWGGFTLAPAGGGTAAVKLMGNVIFASGAIVLLVMAGRIFRRSHVVRSSA